MKSNWQINWRIPIFIFSTAMSIILIYAFFIQGNFFSKYGTDYIAYWSTGKVADVYGYDKIYDLENLRRVLVPVLQSKGITESENTIIRIIPAAYFSFFLIPFQLLSKLSLVTGYWLWTVANQVVLVGYLIFFMRSLQGGSVEKGLKLLIPILVSASVLSNLINGQINVMLMVCAGEFLRNTSGKKPLVAGMWLGGLLIKPPALLLVIPIILIKRNWKILLGFTASSVVILLTSLLLSGVSGVKAMVDLWMGSSTGVSTSNAEAMINWRMLGLNLNHLFDTSLGWVFTALGMVITLVMLYFLIKRSPSLDNPDWVITMLGVFAATLAFTWHAHQHMAMVLIPFLLFAAIYDKLPEQILFLWATVPQVAWFILMILGSSANLIVMAVAFSGFVMNLAIFTAAMRSVNQGD